LYPQAKRFSARCWSIDHSDVDAELVDERPLAGKLLIFPLAVDVTNEAGTIEESFRAQTALSCRIAGKAKTRPNAQPGTVCDSVTRIKSPEAGSPASCGDPQRFKVAANVLLWSTIAASSSGVFSPSASSFFGLRL